MSVIPALRKQRQEDCEFKASLGKILSFFFFFVVLRFELRAYTLSHSHQPLFGEEFFRDRFSQTICPGWL
jgi:hypothetical protein